MSGFAGRRAAAALAIMLAALGAAEAQSQSSKKRERATPAPAQTPADKRDRVVTLANSPFNGRAFWQATAQCGGIYFKLGGMLSDAAIKAKVVKPDPTAHAQLTKSADAASRTATAFFEAAERFLVADRKVARDEAVMTYDAVASDWGDRQKSTEAASAAAKPCPELYQACRAQFPQTCNETSILTN